MEFRRERESGKDYRASPIDPLTGKRRVLAAAVIIRRHREWQESPSLGR
jgi:hypothetical protein